MDKNNFEDKKLKLLEYLEGNSSSCSSHIEKANALQSPDELEILIKEIQSGLDSMDERLSKIHSIMNDYGPKNPYTKPDV